MTVRTERNGRVLVIEFDNGQLSILTPAMHRELYDALRRFLYDKSLSVAMLRGKAGASFSAGDDIKSPMPDFGPHGTLERQLASAIDPDDELGRPGWEQQVMRLPRNKPVVAAVDGYCLGQGFIYLAHLTDIRIASETAKFGLPEIAYGMGGGGGLSRIARQIPYVHAMKALLTGEHFDAQAAARWDIVNEVVPSAALFGRAMDIAEAIAEQPLVALQVEMELTQRSFDLPREANTDYAAHVYRMQRFGYRGHGEGYGFLGKDGPGDG